MCKSGWFCWLDWGISQNPEEFGGHRSWLDGCHGQGWEDISRTRTLHRRMGEYHIIQVSRNFCCLSMNNQCYVNIYLYTIQSGSKNGTPRHWYRRHPWHIRIPLALAANSVPFQLCCSQNNYLLILPTHFSEEQTWKSMELKTSRYPSLTLSTSISLQCPPPLPRKCRFGPKYWSKSLANFFLVRNPPKECATHSQNFCILIWNMFPWCSLLWGRIFLKIHIQRLALQQIYWLDKIHNATLCQISSQLDFRDAGEVPLNQKRCLVN